MNLGTLAVQGESTTALQLYWLLRVWLIHRTGRHSRRKTRYYFVLVLYLSSIYQTLNISFGGTVVRTAKLHFFVCLYQPFLTTLGCTDDFSRVRELSKASHGASAFHHTPSSCRKRGVVLVNGIHRRCTFSSQP